MRSIPRFAAAAAATLTRIPIRHQLAHHLAAVRITAAALALAVVFVASRGAPSNAGLTPIPTPPQSILPANVGIAVPTNEGITIGFEAPMDRASVEGGLALFPALPVDYRWRADSRALTVAPRRLWQTDTRYLVVLPADTRLADGRTVGGALRLSFTTQTAPTVVGFRVAFADGAHDPATPQRSLMMRPAPDMGSGTASPPPDTAADVSSGTAIRLTFNAAIDHSDVERNFTIAPRVDGRFSWAGDSLSFTPAVRLKPGSRYAVSVTGAHDLLGNALRGDATFSFTTRSGGQLVKARPNLDDTGVVAPQIVAWFSQPLDVRTAAGAFSLTDLTTAAPILGRLSWSAAGDQATFTARDPLAGGHRFQVTFGPGTRDADGNRVTATWTFTTKAPPAAPPAATAPMLPGPPAPAPPASGDAVAFALSQINTARAAYGFAPVRLDAAVSAVASAHAWDQARNGYFSHNSLNGMTPRQRLQAAGIPFSASGENQCYYSGLGPIGTLSWCQAQFMAEPYPGGWNHIGNILDPQYTRVGIGIATSGARVIVTWDFVG